MSLTTLNVYCCLCVSLSILKVFLPSLCVFVNYKSLFAVFACLCPSLCVFVNFKRLFYRLCVYLCVFACLCPSLRVFAYLCVSLRSLGVFAVFR